MAEALQSARIGSPDLDGVAYDFLGELLTKSPLNDTEADFVAKWQQWTPAVMAKGVEDTTFYCFDRLVSCNEVGSQPSLVGISADRFHEFCHYLSDRWPNSMLATSTHDNKRSEDVRTRISILSEIPDRWSEALHLWSQLNAAAWRNRLPDRHAEYLLYQTLIGAWPIDRERCWQYMLKACREAKINTSWHEPNNGYEEKIRGFVNGVFDTPEFIASLERFIEPLVLPGRINSLAQTLIKMVAPGVPDFYQGTELWDLSLVDPDNRRPVDFELRSQLMKRGRSLTTAAVLAEWDSGLPKLWMTDRILSMRRKRGDDFSVQSRYQPLVAQGSHLGRLLAFRRGENLIAVVPRFTHTLAGEWGDTRLPLPGGVWRNCFTDELVQREVSPQHLFRSFPVALLFRDAHVRFSVWAPNAEVGRSGRRRAPHPASSAATMDIGRPRLLKSKLRRLSIFNRPIGAAARPALTLATRGRPWSVIYCRRYPADSACARGRQVSRQAAAASHHLRTSHRDFHRRRDV